MTAALSAPAPSTVELLVLAVVLLFVAYVCVFEIGLPYLRHHLRERRRGGYLIDQGRERLP